MPKSFDKQIEEMMEADAIRATLVPGGSKTFYLIEEPWTMTEEPWVCCWYDNRVKALCQVNLVGNPFPGEKYVLFITSDEQGNVKNYVFLQDQYHFSSGEEDAPVVD